MGPGSLVVARVYVSLVVLVAAGRRLWLVSWEEESFLTTKKRILVRKRRMKGQEKAKRRNKVARTERTIGAGMEGTKGERKRKERTEEKAKEGGKEQRNRNRRRERKGREVRK